MTVWFVSRHQGAVDWLDEQGINVDHRVEHLAVEEVQKDDRVIGTLPINLVAEVNRRGAHYQHLILTLPPELRGKDLSAAEMRAHGARLESFTARQLPQTPATALSASGPGPRIELQVHADPQRYAELRVKFDTRLDSYEHVLSMDAYLQSLEGQAMVDKLLVDGPLPTPVAALLGARLPQLAHSFALHDPKISAGVIVHPPAQRGRLIRTRPDPNLPQVKVVLMGPPRSGKSVLRVALCTRVGQQGARCYAYPLVTNPDGEGAAYARTVGLDQAAGQAQKSELKSDFHPARVSKWSDWVRDCPVPLSVVDVGGVISDENRLICAHATHAVILYPRDESDKLQPWRDFAHELGVQILAEVASDYAGERDVVDATSTPITGSIYRLERGEDASTRPMVGAIAAKLIALAYPESA